MWFLSSPFSFLFFFYGFRKYFFFKNRRSKKKRVIRDYIFPQTHSRKYSQSFVGGKCDKRVLTIRVWFLFLLLLISQMIWQKISEPCWRFGKYLYFCSKSAFEREKRNTIIFSLWGISAKSGEIFFRIFPDTHLQNISIFFYSRKSTFERRIE